MAERDLPKVETRVRFPYAAQNFTKNYGFVGWRMGIERERCQENGSFPEAESGTKSVENRRVLKEAPAKQSRVR